MAVWASSCSATALQQSISQGRDAAYYGLDLWFVLQLVEVLAKGVGDDVTEFGDAIRRRVVNDEDSMSEVLVVPEHLCRSLELFGSEVAETINLVLHRYGEDLGMLDDVHWWLGRGRGGVGCRSGT